MEGVGHAFNQSIWRIIGDEAAGQFRGDELCSARVVDQQVADFFAVLHAASMDFLAKNELRAGIVKAIVEFEFGMLARFLDSPSGEAAGHFGNIFLGITAIDAEGVKLHEFAAIVFVQAAFLFLVWIGRWHRPRVWPTAHGLAKGALLRSALRSPGIG